MFLFFLVVASSMLGGSLVTTAWRVLRLRMEETSLKPEGKRLLGRPRRRWVDNIKMYLRKVGWNSMDWIDLAQDRDQWKALVNTV
jgi:hypothetical protein